MKKRLLSMLLVACMVVSMLPMQVWAAEEDGWYWGTGTESTTLYIKDGSITKGKLYSALTERFGTPISSLFLKGYYYVNKGTNTTSATDTTNVEFTHNQNFEVWKTTKSGYAAEQTSQGNITVKYYYDVMVETVGCTTGSVTYNNTDYANGASFNYIKDSGAITLNNMDGYNTPTASGVGVTPESSGTLKVTYTSAEAAKRNVELKVEGGGYGSATLSESGAVPEETIITITATPSTAAGYVESVTLNGEEYVTADAVNKGSFANRVYTGEFTVGTEAVEVVVTFAERTIAMNTAPYSISINKALNPSDQRDAIISGVVAAVVKNAPAGAVGTPDVQFYQNGVGGFLSSWVSIADGNGTLINAAFNDGSESIRVIYAGDARYPEVYTEQTVTVGDSREPFTIASATGEGVTYVIDANDTAVEEASKKAIEASALAAADIPGDATGKVTYAYTLPENLTDAYQNVEVTVTVAADANYLQSSGTVTVPVRGNYFTVTWLNGDGSVIRSESLLGGTIPTPPGNNPVKAADAQYTYQFANSWSPAVEAISSDVTYEPQFNSTVNKYTITWVVDGTVTTKELEYGATPVYEGTPSKADTAQYDYKFTGWDKEIATVTGDTTYTAQFSPTLRSYTVTWVNIGGGALGSDTVEYGKTPVYQGATPVYDGVAEEGKTYTFTGWTPAISTVSGDVTYTAAYSTADVQYMVTFNNNGTVTEQKVDHGDAVSAPADPTRDGFRFDGWYLGEEKYDFSTPITDNITLTAKWVKQVTVTFDVAGIADQTFDIGGKATAPAAPSQTGKVFLGWYLGNAEYDFDAAVSESIALTAKWGEDKNGNNIDDATEPRYTVTYTDGVEENVFDDQVTSGILTGTTTPVFNGTPARTGYIFGGWGTVAETVTADVTYTAVWIVDSNQNGVADSRETISVTVGENGALTINGETVTSGSYLYDSAAVSALNVMVTPNSGWYTDVAVTGAELTGFWAKTDIDDSWLGTDNRHIYTGSFPVAADGEYTLGVTFGQRTVTVANDGSEVQFNPYKADHAGIGGTYADYPVALSAAIETALVGEDKSDVSIKIYVDTTKSWADLNNLWIGALNVGTEKIQVTWAETDKYPAVSGEFTVKLVDERTAAPLADADLGLVQFVNASEVDAFLADNAAQYNPNGLTADIAIQDSCALPTERNESKEVKYNVTFPGNETYKAASCVVTLTAQLRSDIALVTFTEGSGNASVVGQTASESGVYSLNGGETYTVTATPETGSYVKSIVVSAVGKEDQSLELSYASQVASASFSPEKSVDYTITVTYDSSAFTKAEDPTMSFRPGWTQPNDKDIYTTVITDPAYDSGTVTVKYLARPATSIPVEIPAIGELYAGGTIDIPLADLWLSAGEPIPEVNVEKEKDKAIDAIKDALAAKDYTTAGSLIKNLGGTLAEALKYYDAHAFGTQSTEKLTVTYTSDVKVITDNTLVINLVDDRAETTISGANVASGTLVYNQYTNADVLAAIAPVVMVGETQVTTDRITISDLEGADAGTHTVTIKFLGDAGYKPSESTVTVVVDKAPCSIDFDSQVVVYGTDYDFTLVKNPVGVETVDFMVGLDLLDVDGKTVTPYVHVVLPGWLGEIIKSDTTLNGLKEDLPKLAALGVPQSAVDGIIAVLQEVQDTLKLDDLVVKIGGEMKPENIGLYLAGAVTVDGNYQTAYTVDYLVIVPDAKQAQLHWVYDDENGIITQAALKNNPGILGAYGTVEGESVDEITAVTQYLLMQATVDANGELVFDLIQADAESLNNITANGAYVQLAYYMDDWGNEFYYAVPIARPFLILPNTVNVAFKDLSGDENYDRIYTFDNQAHDMGAIEVTDRVGNVLTHDHLTVTYYGVQTNGQVYNSTEAPVHAGVYTATALYLERDEAGEIVNVGMALGVMLIKPAETATVVEDAIKAYDAQGHALSGLIQVTTGSGVDPDTTIISASLAAEGDFSQDGFAAVEGNVNVDFPAWLDQILAEQYPQDFVDGVNAADVLEKFKSYQAKLTELGVSAETLTAVTNALSKLPQNATLTFRDDVVCTQVGVYAVMAVVTDSDHLPSADTGILVIVPTVEKDYLKFNYEDANNIFTQSLLAKIDLGASAYTDDTYSVLDEEATASVVDLFIHVDETGSIVAEGDSSKLTPGAYIQVSYIPFQVDNQMVFSDLIARPVIIVPDTLKVTFKDVNDQDNYLRKFTYDGQAHDIGRVEVSELDGALVDTIKGTLTVTYLGVEGDGEGYRSTQAPSQAGLYTVIATYVEKDGENVLRAGAMVGGVLIEKAAMTFDLLDTTVDYNGQSQFVDVTNPENADYVSVTVDKEANVANIVLEDDLNALVELLKQNGIEVGEQYVLDELLTKVHQALATAEGAEVPEFAAAAFEQMLTKLESVIPKSGTVTINGDGPVNVGVYQAYAAAYSANYASQLSEGTLTIEPAKVTITVHNVSKFYKEADPELTYTVTGLVGEDDLGIQVSRKAGEEIGTYAITATYTANNNYVVTVVNGALVIKDRAGFQLSGRVEGATLTVEAKNLSVSKQTARFLVATYINGQLAEAHMEELIPVDGQSSWIKTQIQLDSSVTQVKFFALDQAHCPLAELWSWNVNANN